MKTKMIAAVGAAAAAAAWGWGSLVASYPSPGAGVTGLGALSYQGTDYITAQNGHYVWLLYESTGSVAASYPAPGNTWSGGMCSGVLGGVAQHWLSKYDPVNDKVWVYRCAFATGSVLGSFSAFNSNFFVHDGLAFQPVAGSGYLYYADGTTGIPYIYRMQAETGSVYGSFYPPGEPWDIDFGGGYLWVWTYPNEWCVWQMTTTGSVVNNFWPAAQGMEGGVAYDDVGPYLWLAQAGVLNGYELSLTGVAPASLGKVKALFR